MGSESPVAGRFEVLGIAGSGGMGAVLRARDLVTGEPIALKVLRGQDAEARFELEARILSELRHPGIVRYVAHGKDADGFPYLAMEWLDGEDLAARLARESLTVGESVELVRRAAEALHVAHSRGVIHRDIKPSNLFLCGGRIDRVKLLDFGIARMHASPSGALARNGIVIGTPGYMSPEQAMDGLLDARTDIFSLGCVLFECLAGEPPFLAEDNMALLAKILLQDAPRIRDIRGDIDPALDEILACMLAKDVNARYADALLVAHALAQLDASGAIAPVSVRHRPKALGAGEQGLLCVVLIANQAMATTQEVELGKAQRRRIEISEELDLTLKQAGGRVTRMVNGSAVVTLRGEGAATDLATRAARCALSIRESLPTWPVVLAMGRGVISKGTPVGEVIDRAARVLRAGIGGVLELPTLILDDDAKTSRRGAVKKRNGLPVFLDSVSAALLEARFDIRPGPAGMELHGERTEAESTRTLLGRTTPCLGREEELRVLQSIYESIVGGAGARAVLLVGEPGIGKSRLRAEFLRRIARSTEGAEVLVGYGDPVSAGSPFAMIASAMRSLCGISPGDPGAQKRDKLHKKLSKSLSDHALLHAMEFLGELIGLQPEGEMSVAWNAALADPLLMGDQMRRSWQEWISAELASNTLIIVLEDLHWGDLPSVRFVDAALQVGRSRPLMVLATARPEVHLAFPGLWKDRTLIELSVGELPAAASTELVRQVLGPDVPEALTQQLCSQASGNAFYLEELIRAASENRTGSLPPTVLAMVHSRLMELGAEERRVLRAASVFGQVFWRDGVLSLLGGGEIESVVNASLSVLVREELCGSRQKARFKGEAEYAFQNTSVREAAYTMLTDNDRVTGHRLAAQWLEQAGEKNSMVLAEHYERGHVPMRARYWYQRAAEQALEGGDFSAAFERAERAIACGASAEEFGHLRLIAALALRWQGRNAEAERYAFEAMAHLARGSDPWYRAATEAVLCCTPLGKRDEVAAVSLEMIELATSAGGAGRFALSALAQVTTRLYIADHYDIATKIIEKIDSQIDNYNSPEPELVARIAEAKAAQAFFANGNLEIFLERISEALFGYEQAGDLRNACHAGSNLGFAFIAIGSYGEAVHMLRTAIERGERMGLGTVAGAYQNLGIALGRLGQTEEAKRSENEAIRLFIAQSDQRMEGGARIYLAMLCLEEGDLAAAESEASAAVSGLSQAPSMRIHALATLALVHLKQGRIEEAKLRVEDMMRLLTEQMASFESLGDSAEAESFIRLAHAEVLHAAGDVGQAQKAIRAARDRLLERAQRFRSEARRAVFLRDIPENARILVLADAW